MPYGFMRKLPPDAVAGYKYEDDVATRRDPMSLARTLWAGQIWRHYKGGQYEIVCVAKMEADLTHVVVYRALVGGDAKTWVRPLSNFLELVPTTSTFRFERLT